METWRLQKDAGVIPADARPKAALLQLQHPKTMYHTLILFIAMLALVGSCFAYVRPTGLKTRAFTGTPQLAFADGDGCIDPADVQDFGSKDVNRIQGNIAKAIARNSPYADVLEGGTLPSGVSDTVRAIVQEQAVLNQSLVAPVMTDDVDMCGLTGEEAEVGTTEYSYKLQTLRGKGPLVCVKGMRNAFETSYSVAEDSLKKAIVKISNADIRSVLVSLSGVKATVHSGQDFDQMVDGDMQDISTPFPHLEGAPNAPLNFKLLQAIGRRMREDLLVEPWEGGEDNGLLKFIGGQDILDILRDDLEVRTDHRYLAAGSYDVGNKQLTRYRWEGPYRGWAFGVDSQPLRFSSVNGSGQPVFIEPEIRKEVSGKGVGSRPNPAWIRAKYEVALAVGGGSFRRLAPAQYNGEGGFKFPAQTTMGELIWRVIMDNCNNVWGDFGRHYYQYSRAIRPERPHAVCAIAFARPQVDYGLTATSNYGDFSSTASL